MEGKKQQIFVIQPFGPASEAVYEMIASAATKAGATIYRADSMPIGTSIIHDIQKAIQDASLLIADLSNANPNVMYEVGFAQAQQRPLIFIANSSRNIPFDLAGMRTLIYDLSAPHEFVDRLTNLISKALKSPETFLFAKVEAEREKRQNVFISYSHEDRDYLDRLLVHLKPLEKDGLIELWVDTRLRAGDRWKKEIEKALERSTVAILLLSADFLASDFITNNELPDLLRNAEDQGTRIIPLIVKPCRFTRDKNLRHFQAINDPKDALILLSLGKQEVYLDLVASEVERMLQRS